MNPRLPANSPLRVLEQGVTPNDLKLMSSWLRMLNCLLNRLLWCRWFPRRCWFAWWRRRHHTSHYFVEKIAGEGPIGSRRPKKIPRRRSGDSSEHSSISPIRRGETTIPDVIFRLDVDATRRVNAP